MVLPITKEFAPSIQHYRRSAHYKAERYLLTQLWSTSRIENSLPSAELSSPLTELLFQIEQALVGLAELQHIAERGPQFR